MSWYIERKSFKSQRIADEAIAWTEAELWYESLSLDDQIDQMFLWERQMQSARPPIKRTRK